MAKWGPIFRSYGLAQSTSCIMRGGPYAGRYPRITNYTRPVETLLAADERGTNGDIYWGGDRVDWWDGGGNFDADDFRLRWRHGNRATTIPYEDTDRHGHPPPQRDTANFLFLDGHAEMRKATLVFATGVSIFPRFDRYDWVWTKFDWYEYNPYNWASNMGCWNTIP